MTPYASAGMPGGDNLTPTSTASVDVATRLRAASVLAVFDRNRLRQARELRSLTQAALAALSQASERDFSAAAVSFWESGQNRPAPETLALVAQLLDVPVEFFAIDARDGGSDTPAYFRSLRNTPVAERRRARARVQLAHRLVGVLEECASFPELRIPRIPVQADAGPDEVEQVARQLRDALGVRTGPIRDVVNLMERNGVVVVRLSDVHAKIDAFSVPFQERPIVALGADKQDRARSRMDAAHELIHLTCHDPEEEPTVQLEKQATQIGAAFLTPRDEFLSDLHAERLTWSRLAELKVKWMISIQAIVARARATGFITDSQYTQMAKTMSVRGWRKPNGEPVSLGPTEQPNLLAGAVRAAGLDLPRLAALAALPIDEVASLIEATRDRRTTVSF